MPQGASSNLLNYYIQCFSEFERIGDYATNIAEAASEINTKGIVLSPYAHRELSVLGEAIAQVLDYSYKAFTKLDSQKDRAGRRSHRRPRLSAALQSH